MERFQTEQPTILLLGPAGSRMQWVKAQLRGHYKVRQLCGLEPLMQCLAASGDLPGLILLDSKLPLPERAELLRRIHSKPETWSIPVLLFGMPETPAEELLGFEQGAADFIVLPLHPDIFRAKIRARLAPAARNKVTRLHQPQREAIVARRAADLGTVQDVTLRAMTGLAKTRDIETGNHICRTQHYVRALCGALQANARFTQFLSAKNVDLLFKSAPLHDIGKVGIPDRILLKPGRLDADEMAIMQTHTTLGRDAIEYAESLLDEGGGFLTFAREIAYSHHEKWDGSGYPQGLAGDAIPVAARLMAVADVYDALTSRRVYKPDLPHAVAVDIILQGKGLHFDPDIVEAFQSVADEFQAIACSYADRTGDISLSAVG